MKYLSVMLLMSFNIATSQTKHKVTVKAKNSIQQLYIAGDFTNWEIEKMEKDNSGLWIFSFQASNNITSKYFYLEGPDWDSREAIGGSPCFIGKDRVYEFSKRQVDIFGDCDIKSSNVASVKMILDVREITNSKKKYYIAGDFTGWEMKEMTKKSKTKFVFTAMVNIPFEGKYFYLDDKSWDAKEPPPGATCAYENDRVISINDKKVVYEDVFGDCN